MASYFSGTPSVSASGENTLDVRVVAMESGIYFGVVLPSGATAPSTEQVMAGQNGSGTQVPSGYSASRNNIAVMTFNFTNLVSGSDWDIYIATTSDATPKTTTGSTTAYTGPDKFVDLSLGTDGHLGSPSDPFSFTDFATSAAAQVDTSTEGILYYLKGSVANSFNGYLTPRAMVPGYPSIPRVSFLPWDLALYGPWRMSIAVATMFIPYKVSGGIIEFSSQTTLGTAAGNWQSIYYNCIIKGSLRFLDSSPNYPGVTFNGCNVIGDIAVTLTGKITLVDSIFTGQITGGNGAMRSSINFTSSVFVNSFATIFATPGNFNVITNTNNQYGWTAPTWPTWVEEAAPFSTNKANWDLNSLFTGASTIDTPPEPGAGYPEFTNYSNDLWGGGRFGVGTGYMPPPPVPVWVDSPTLSSTTPTSATFSSSTDISTTEYAVVIARGDTAPTAAQVRAGKDSTDAAALSYTTVALNAGTPTSIELTGLAEGTLYDAYIVTSYQASPVSVQFETSIPVWVNSPVASEILLYQITISASTDVATTMNAVVVTSGATPPTTLQVISGTDGDDNPAVTYNYIDLEADVLSDLILTDLESDTHYDAYVVANGQVEPIRIQFSTASEYTVNYKDFGGILNVLDFKISDIKEPTLSLDFNKLNIDFVGVSNPENTNVTLTVYEYSIDSSATWNTMTIDSVVTDLTFSEAGETNVLVWEIKSDIGKDIYNTTINIRFKAEATFNLNNVVSDFKVRSIYLNRTLVAAPVKPKPVFTPGYKGNSGQNVSKNKPKTAS